MLYLKTNGIIKMKTMKKMKKIMIICAGMLLVLQPVIAQEIEDIKYKRSSIYSLMIKHENQDFADTIASVFLDMPVPDKYNGHDLSVKVVSVSKKKTKKESVDDFLDRNKIASRLVTKWFNWDKATGVCNTKLIEHRGNYNASMEDVALAKQNVRGLSMLSDAGLELIGNTFVLVNDIRYIDRSKGSADVGALLNLAGGFASIFTNNSSYSDLGENMASIAESYKGFKVKIMTHLYQLVWDEEAENVFYNNIWKADSSVTMPNIDEYRGKFKLRYVGSQESDGSKTSFMGINEDEPRLMVRKACQRALDDNVANLQKNFDVFKVKVPLLSTEPLIAEIGKKEGITTESRYEVLETRTEDGKTTYKRVGVIRPVEGKIWDNRFMAAEEKADGADLRYTTFKKVSGGDFYPGLLIREIK